MDLVKYIKFFKLSFDNSPQVVFLFHPSSKRMLACNKKGLDFYGYTLEEITNINISKINILPEDIINQRMSDVLDGKYNKFEFIHTTKNNKLINVAVNVNKIEIEGNNYLIVFVDEKENPNNINKLEESESNFRSFFEREFRNNPAIMALINYEDGLYIDINDSYTKILGFTKEEIIGKTLEQIRFHTLNDEGAKIIHKLDEDGKFSNIIMQVYDKNANIKYGNFSGEIIDNQGEKALLIVMIDVTEEVVQQQEIESFFSVSLDLLCIIDVEGKLLKVNNAWSEFLQVPKDKIINTYLINYIHKDEVEDWYNALGVLNNGELLLSYVNRLFSDSIGQRYFEWRAIPMDGRIFAAGRDITNRIIRESEVNDLLEQVIESKEAIETTLYQKNALIDEIELSKKKLEESVQEKNSLINQLEETKIQLEKNIEEKEKFFSIIAHDLKSPFSGFLGLTKILSEEIFDLSMREMQDFAHSLKLAADNLYKLLENLLEWSRVKRGLVKFSPKPLKLNELIKTNVDIVNSKATLKHITISNYVEDYVQISADEDMLNAILRNLISNAVKFTPHNGRIIIDALADDHKVLVSIQDTGIGMPPEIKQKLFTIGEKVSRPGTDGEPSTGLGLALCKEYIDLHHGKIWAESKINHGTTFYFVLKIK